MRENKKAIIFLAVTEAMILLLLAGYPIIKKKINEYRQRDISLAQEETAGESQKPAGNKKKEPETLAEKSNQPEDTQGEEVPEVLLALGEGAEKLEISLWRSQSGNCYFFLPGYGEGAKLQLVSAQGGYIRIGDAQIHEGDRLWDISGSEGYEFTLFDKNGEALLQAPVFFMYSSGLPVLSLTTESGVMTGIDGDKTQEEPGTVTLYDESGGEIYAGTAESVRGRGNSTWGLSKKPYQFRLLEEADFFGMGEAKAWNLLANGYDETRLRNGIVLGLAQALGMDFVPEYRMVDLYINNVYYGNYYLTEKIKVGENSVSIRDMEEIAENIFRPEELKKFERMENEEGTRKWVAVAYEDSDITGGYLFERELPTRFQDEISGFVTSQGDCYALKSPVYATENQVNYIADLMQEFQDAIEEEDGIHPETGKHYSEYIDMDSFVQKYLVEEISKNFDGGVTSSFFYKPQDEASQKIFAGPVWDYDVALGNCNLDRIAGDPEGITRMNNHVHGTDVFARLYEKEDFYTRMVALYREKAIPYLEYLLEEGIDRMVGESRASTDMDSIRWESLANRYQYYQEYDNDIRYLKYFISQRMDFLNEVWIEGKAYCNVAFVVDDEYWEIVCVEEGGLPGREPIPYRYDVPSLFMGWVTEDGVSFDQFKPVYEDMTFYAIWQELDKE